MTIMDKITPLTLQEYAKKRNEIAKRYGNKTMAPYMWKKMYETSYLPGLKSNDPTILSVFHGIKTAARQFKIYCDMDGVFTDFKAAVKKLGPEAEKGLDESADPETKQVMYDAIEDAGDSFWALMPWMSHGEALWNWLSQFNPVLLTSPGKFTYAVSGKIEWIKKNIPGTSVFFEEEKWRYAERKSILIDDKEENIEAWRNMHGIGILHKDFQTTKDAVLMAIKSISPSRADNVITMEVIQDIHRSLQASMNKRPVAELLRDVLSYEGRF